MAGEIQLSCLHNVALLCSCCECVCAFSESELSHPMMYACTLYNYSTAMHKREIVAFFQAVHIYVYTHRTALPRTQLCGYFGLSTWTLASVHGLTLEQERSSGIPYLFEKFPEAELLAMVHHLALEGVERMMGNVRHGCR